MGSQACRKSCNRKLPLRPPRVPRPQTARHPSIQNMDSLGPPSMCMKWFSRRKGRPSRRLRSMGNSSRFGRPHRRLRTPSKTSVLPQSCLGDSEEGWSSSSSSSDVGFYKNGIWQPRARTASEQRAHVGGGGPRRTQRRAARVENYLRGTWKPAWLQQYIRDRDARQLAAQPVVNPILTATLQPILPPLAMMTRIMEHRWQQRSRWNLVGSRKAGGFPHRRSQLMSGATGTTVGVNGRAREHGVLGGVKWTGLLLHRPALRRPRLPRPRHLHHRMPRPTMVSSLWSRRLTRRRMVEWH